MMKQIILFALMAAMFGCTSNQKAGNNTAAEGTDSVMLSEGYEAVSLFKSKTGHITATLKVNGKPCVFLIDTGGGATLIDKSKKEKYGLAASRTGDYAAGIGSRSPLVKTSATLQVNENELEVDDLYLMDIAYLNSEFKKYHARQVDGVLGTDFLEKYQAVIDYSQSKLYLKSRKEE